jgi:hypothetical protein
MGNQAETWDTEARKQHFILPAQTQRTYVQRLSPENKGVSPYIPFQGGYRGKKKKNPQKQGHMQFCRLLHLSARCPSTPTALSLCFAIPSSLLLYQNAGRSVFLLVLLPAALFLPFDAQTHLGSKSII